ncbi:hypothetical protein H0H81_010736 [Sphagnurus paluster]|uniref:Uncharacterized protein n=1 Tax=Sphagnurus paluster TaxID=117069 RepID=A0A9P7GIY5_9AGAR|nr:hypothetical protein H0H81_010736 [Sphagnurus paluster]
MIPAQPIYLDEKSESHTLLPTHAGNPEAAPERPQCKGRRKLRFLAAILFAWVGLRVFGDCLQFLFGMYHRTDGMEPTNSMGWPVPPDVTVEECAEWQGDFTPGGSRVAFHEPYTSSARFQLPISSDKLFLLARGMASGAVKVLDGGDGEDVKLGVVAHYRFKEALESFQVCTVTRGERENGFGIFGPEWSRRNIVRFEVSVYLPKAIQGSVLDVKNFETDLPLFSHFISDLEHSVHFDAIHLQSSNLPIIVKSLNADKATIETRNSPIDGNFNVTSSLKLLTANAHVNVNVNLYNDEEKEITHLQIGTSNSDIKGTLTLQSAQRTRGKFQVTATTSNAPIDLHFSDAPVDSTLLLDAHTSNAPANVKLHETFEGAFTASSSLKRPTVFWQGHTADPAGKGRERKVSIDVRGTTVSGSVRWEGENNKEVLGDVRVGTSLAPLTLRL